MSLALKILNGTITQIGSADNLQVNTILRNGAAGTITLGTGADTISIPGNLDVDGTMTVSSTATYEGNVNLGNGGDTINIGSGATDTINLNNSLVIGTPATTTIGSSTTDYVAALWQAKVAGTAGNTAVALNAITTTAAGSWAVGVDISPFTVVSPTDSSLQTVLVALDAAIGGTSETLQEAYDNGPDILQTAADGGIEITRGTSTDTHVLSLVDAGTAAQPVFTVSKTGASSANAVSISTGINVTGGNALFVNNLGAGSALTVQDGGSNVLNIDAAGKITATPTSGQNFAVTAAGAGTVDVTAAAAVNIDSTGAGVSIGAAGGSDFTVTGAALTLQTVTSGDVNVTAAGVLNMDAASATLDTTGAFSVDGAAASNVSVTGANLTLSTVTSGEVLITGVTATKVTDGAGTNDVVTVTGAGAFSATPTSGQNASITTGGAGTISLTTNGSADLNVTAAGILNMDGASATLDTSTTFSIDGGSGTSNITQANGALTITAGSASTWSTSSGALSVTSADQLNLTAAAATNVVVSTSTTGGIQLTTAPGGSVGGAIAISSTAGAGGTASDIQIQSNGASDNAGDVIIGTSATTPANSGGLVLYAGGPGPTPVAGGINIASTDNLVLAAGATTDITFEAQGAAAPIPFNDSTDPDLSGFTSTSIVGALNELKAGEGATTVTIGNNAGGVTAGRVVRLTSTADTVEHADAADDEQATIGIALNTASAGANPVRVVVCGRVTGVATVVAGTRYFLGTAGALTATAPGSGNLERRIGWADTTTSLIVCIGEGVVLA